VARIDIPNDFGFTDEHELLRREARRFLEERCPISEVRRLADDPSGYDPAVWKELGQLGWVGLVMPEALGGAGLGQLHLALLLEEMGRRLLPSPYLGCVLAGIALESGGEAQRERWGRALASGETIATLAFSEPDGTFEPESLNATAEPVEGGWVLRGEKASVPYAASATLIVAPFREPDARVGLFAVESSTGGVTIENEVCIDLTRRTARVHFDGVRVAADARLEGDGGRALRRTLVRAWGALAAEMVGGAETTLGLTRDYAIERKQFDRPIGSFQAVKHPLVDMMVAIEFARSHAYAAAAALDQEASCAETCARMAKAQASEAFAFAVGRAVQLHGGYGFTWDCDVHFYFRRALWSRALLGDGMHHRRHLAAELFAEHQVD
jgi:alkylation response protein AidB-like acyl-CoA dehydrogenase